MRTAPGAFWASWADALPMLQQRLPPLIAQVVHHLSHPDAPECLGELQESVDRDGFIARPCWEMLRRGVRPRPPLIVEPGEWHHSWQYCSSSSSEHHFRRRLCLSSRVLPTRPICDHTLEHVPTKCCTGRLLAEFRVKPLFRTLVLEWLRLPLLITKARCECGGFLDFRGQHRAARPRSGRLRSRAVPTKRTLARVCREAGATVRRNAKLRDMNISVPGVEPRSATGGGYHSLECRLMAQWRLKPATTRRRSMWSRVKAIDASSWWLASRQGDGGALRHSHLSSNWQLHVHAKPRLHCGSPR